MQPELDLGPITLQTFGICFAVAFLLAGALVARRLREIGEDPDWSYELIFAALIGGLIGARVDYLIQNWSDVSDDLLGSVFSGSGLVWLGGVIGGALGVVLWARLARFPAARAARPVRARPGARLRDRPRRLPALGRRRLRDRVGPAVGDGLSGGNGRDRPRRSIRHRCTRRWRWDCAALVLWHLRDRFRPGILFAIYLVIAGVERFLIELIRRNDSVVAGLTQAQLISVVMAIVGAAWLLRARGRGGLAAAQPA